VLKYKRFIIGQLETNSYIVYSDKTNSCFIIDPADISEDMNTFITKKKLTPNKIILTHGHMDHCGGAEWFSEKYNIGMILHKDDKVLLSSPINMELKKSLGLLQPPEPERYLTDNEILKHDDIELKVIHTPGHTPGSISIVFEDKILSGDTLFFGSIGRTDLPGGDFKTIKKSLQRLIEFPDSTIILPGHGEETTIEQEKRINPFL